MEIKPIPTIISLYLLKLAMIEEHWKVELLVETEVIVNVKIIILVSNQILKTIHLIEDKTDVN